MLSYNVPRYLCPALTRTIRTNSRAAPNRIKDPLVQNIDKLEAYIKSLQKDVKKKSAKFSAEKQAKEVTETEIAAMYESLAGPAQQSISPPTTGLTLALSRKLSIDRSRLDTVDWEKVADGLVKTGKIDELRTVEINKVLKCMPHDKRIKYGLKVMQAMAPDRITFDLFMDSYATLSQVDNALEMFDHQRKAGFTSSIYSYAHLMKAFAIVKDLPRASAMYKYMQEQGVEPNLVVSTSLMATCIRAGQVTQAFSIFDDLKYKSTRTAPDARTYSLMIFACSLDPTMSAERASDLYTEMTERGLKPTKETFNALIHVYAARKDYFTEAWRISETMLRMNVEMDKVTWHSLLSACVGARDIVRARTLVKEMTRMGKRNPLWKPDAITYQLLFRNYAHAKVRKSLNPSNILEHSTNEHQVVSSSSSGDGDVWIEETPLTSNTMLRESARVMRYLRENSPKLLSTQMVDTYMIIAQSFEARDRFLEDWKGALYEPHEKGRHSFQIALSACYVFKDYEFLQRVWEERKTWRMKQGLIRGTAVSASTLARRDEYGDFEANKTYIEALSRMNRMYQATEALQRARSKFHFRKEDLKCFQTKSIQVGDEEAVLLYREMFPDESNRYKSDRYY